MLNLLIKRFLAYYFFALYEYYIQKGQFHRRLLNMKCQLKSKDGALEQAMDTLLGVVQNSVICVGEANFFMVDYAFICQVRK